MQDSVSGLAGCTSSRVGRDIVWKFLQKNWSKLAERFGEKSSFLISFVEVIVSLGFILDRWFPSSAACRTSPMKTRPTTCRISSMPPARRLSRAP